MIDFNTEPYNDDFDENNKFYRILFRPSYAVQARELTQLQSILQNQIKRHGDHIFKEGAMVIPGQMSIDTDISYIKVQAVYGGAVVETYINNLNGQVIVGASGLTAKVLKVVNATGSDPTTLYVRYTNSATDNTTKKFADGEVLTPEDPLLSAYAVQAATTDATGVGSIATIERGVYYVNGHFVLCDTQTITLDKYDNTPSYRVGLSVVEKLITPEDEGYEMLLDNAQNSYNFAAPGAHRYYIDLTLDKRELTSTDDVDFIELLRVNEGQIQRHVVTTDYSYLEKTLARRTFDESGNYVVRNFNIDVREHRNNNRGAWASNTAYLIGDVVTSAGYTYVAKNSGTSVTTAPTHTTGTAYDGPGSTGIQWEWNQTPYYNRGVYSPAEGGDESKLAVGLEPGKAYIQGYEIEKISTEYVAVDKSRTFVQVDNATVPATVGNYVRVTNVNNLPPVESFGIVTLYDRVTGSSGRGTAVGTAVGTARVRFIEWDNGTIGTNAAVYKLGLFDIKMTGNANFNRKVKSVYFNVSSDPQLSFTADIVPITTRLVGSVSQSTNTVTGSGTSFQTDLVVGDYVYVGSTLSRVTAISSQQSMTVDTSATQTGVTLDRVTTNVLEPENLSLIYKLPYYAIRSVRSSLGTNDTSYTVYEKFSGTASSASGGTCTLTVSTSSGEFASAAETDNYIVMDNNATDGGSIIAPTSISVTGSTVQFTLPSTYATRNLVVIGAVNKSGSTLTEKAKTLVSTTSSFTSQSAATKSIISLGKADGFRLISVKMDTGSFSSPTGSYNIDITDRFDFDSGQRDTHYDVASVVLKASYTPPVAPIRVEFEYFNHSTGDYFTVNSYPSNVAYSAIPTYNGSSLRDVIDFRPRIDDSGVSFSGAGSSASLVPKRGIDIRADYTYYLARKTKIAVDFNGQFFAIDGVPSLNPGDAIDPALGMVLYNLTLEPFTFGTSKKNVIVESVDNKRYTMRDIGKLEKRIDNLEYYTSLSLLEQQTESLDIIDSNGDTRFKNGFIVDNFTGHNTGEVTSQDYFCAIDMEQGELRPFYSMQNINLIEKNSSPAQRALANYQLYGDVLTLPVVDHVPLVKQEYASRLENINPFAIFTFLGNVQLNPASDDWFEVDRRPDLIVDVEGNFNAISTIAEKSGVIGTVWNAWQSQWSGTPVQVSETATKIVDRSRNHASRGGADDGWIRDIKVGTFATEIGLARTGVKTSVVAKIDRQVVADRVLSTAMIPYIRSRNILVQVRGLKPNTRFYPFFDDVSVASYVTPATKITYTPVAGAFDWTTNVGGLTTESARRVNGDTQVCLNRGDVITGQTSGATAVVVGQEYNTETSTWALFVLNVKGTFSNSETIIGSNPSGAAVAPRGTITSVTTASTGGNLVTNFNGEVHMLFNIPNTDAMRFRAGQREFKLVDVVTANGEFTSRGRAMYRAQGVLETRQQTVNAVRNAELVEEQISQQRTIIATSERVVSDSGWYDPLAQTFLVQQKGGAFLTKIDIFFATKDSKIPVNLEIREVVNGYPGKLVLPFSRVSLKPEQVDAPVSGATIDTTKYNTVTLDGVTVAKYDKPTTFTFPSPVYVQDNAEYAIVLSSDSNNYKVWISQVGDSIPGSNRTISEQPYNGVFFKSQNASTWTADQMQDLKFTIYRAKFATDTIANIEFVNDAVPYQTLDKDSLEMRAGQTKVRVWQKDHGMPVGSRVIITDSVLEKLTGYTATGTITASTSTTAVTGVGTSFTTQAVAGTILYNSAGTYIGRVASVASNTSLTLAANASVAVSAGAYKYTPPINGVPSNQIYTTSVISDVDVDSYCITVSNAPTTSGYAGGSTMRATRNIQFDSVQPLLQIQTFSETQTSFGMKTTTGKSVDSTTQTPYVIDGTFNPVLANETNDFYLPRMIASEINETVSLGGSKSLAFNVTMKTTNDSVSPMLDTQRTSLIGISNKLNSPSEVNMNVGGLDDNTVLSANTTIAFSGNTITSTNATARGVLQTLKVGKYLNVSNTSGALNDGTFLITKVADDGTTATVTVDAAFTTQAAGTAVTLKQREMFVAEISPVGSSTYSKYVTKKISLANSSTFIRVKFAGSIPAEAAVDVYYKTSAIGATNDLDVTNYTLMAADAPVVYVQNGSGQFIDMSYSVKDLPAFDTVQVKMVLRSTNTAAVPRVKDLRIIACA